ncbi:hypothetical protein BASA61_002320 [Batrachochytrium salamandrivorans]|nr:hypothetical protein BASA61_002320 [Batrachochytrium salamandrivorans]
MNAKWILIEWLKRLSMLPLRMKTLSRIKTPPRAGALVSSGLGINLRDKGNTDTTDDNHPDNHPDSHPDNQPTFEIQEVPINDSGDTTSKQPDDEVPPRTKYPPRARSLSVRE